MMDVKSVARRCFLPASLASPSISLPYASPKHKCPFRRITIFVRPALPRRGGRSGIVLARPFRGAGSGTAFLVCSVKAKHLNSALAASKNNGNPSGMFLSARAHLSGCPYADTRPTGFAPALGGEDKLLATDATRFRPTPSPMVGANRGRAFSFGFSPESVMAGWVTEKMFRAARSRRKTIEFVSAMDAPFDMPAAIVGIALAVPIGPLPSPLHATQYTHSRGDCQVKDLN